MLYLIIKAKDGEPSPGCNDWLGIHRDLEGVSAAMQMTDLEDRIDVIEINPVERTWRPISTRYGPQSKTVDELVRTIPERRALIPQATRDTWERGDTV